MGCYLCHVGLHIRVRVLPRGKSIKACAAALGIGRPALSNLLNGKAALSIEMALKLEKTFPKTDVDIEHLFPSLAHSLLNWQTAYLLEQARDKVNGKGSPCNTS